jgi:hypothetical protein
MNAHRCCETSASGSRSEPLAPRGLDIAGWIVPGAILALMPKCPACLVAYLAVGTGFGLSLSAATYLRTSLLMLCVALLLYLAVRRLGHFVVIKEALLPAKGHFPTVQTKEIAR